MYVYTVLERLIVAHGRRIGGLRWDKFSLPLEIEVMSGTPF